MAELDELAEELNKRGFPSLRLAPPGEPPYVDVGLPGSMTIGEHIHIQDEMFAWHGQPIGPTSQPAATAAIIASTLRASGRPRS